MLPISPSGARGRSLGAERAVPAPALPDDVLALAMLEHAPVGFLVLDLAALRISRMNAAMRALAERVVCGQRDAQPLDEALLAWLDAQGILALARSASTGGKPVHGIEHECAISLRAGSQLFITCGLTPLPASDAEGGALVLVSIADRTAEWRDRQHVERMAYTAQLYAEKLEVAIEHLSEGVLIRDPLGQVQAYNSAALSFARNRSAVEEARAHGRRLEPEWELHWLDGAPLPEMERPSARAMTTGRPVAGTQLLVVRENGDEVPLLVNAAPLRGEDGLIAGTVVAFHDMSAVKHVERLKDEFISIASHELRQPLTVILGQAQMLGRHLGRQEDSGAITADAAELLRRLLVGIEEQTGRLNQLVTDLLDMSRIQTGQLQLKMARVPVVQMLRYVVTQHESVSRKHTVTLDVRPGVPLDVAGRWDRGRIEQVLMNLLSNAIKYSPTGGKVQVELRLLPDGHVSEMDIEGGRRHVVGPAAHILVSDDGIGIPEEARQRLFERFYRAQNAAGIQGTGLGLYICRGVAWQHGGDLWVESRGTNRGTVFHLALPLLTPADDIAD